MHAQQSPIYPRVYERSFSKTTLLPSVPSSPESNAMRSPVFLEWPSFVTLDQLGHYEDCIAMVSKQVAICRDECVALQECLRLSDEELREKNSQIDCLIAEQQQLKQTLQQTTAIVEALTIKDIQNQQQLFLKTNERVSCTSDERKEKSLLEADGIMFALKISNEDKEQVISVHKEIQDSMSGIHRNRLLINNSEQLSQQCEVLQLRETLQASESAVSSLQHALHEEQLLTQLLKEDQKAHLAIQRSEQSQQREVLQLRETLQASESAVSSLQHALHEEQLLTQLLKEDQKAHLAIQRSEQSQQREVLQLRETLQASESMCNSLRFALQEEQLLNQKFGKVEHLLSGKGAVMDTGLSFVLAELESEKMLTQRLKDDLEESTQSISRILLANSAYQDKVEDLQARIISCNPYFHVLKVPCV
jgi:hypothetical protein